MTFPVDVKKLALVYRDTGAFHGLGYEILIRKRYHEFKAICRAYSDFETLNLLTDQYHAALRLSRQVTS